MVPSRDSQVIMLSCWTTRETNVELKPRVQSPNSRMLERRLSNAQASSTEEPRGFELAQVSSAWMSSTWKPSFKSKTRAIELLSTKGPSARAPKHRAPECKDLSVEHQLLKMFLSPDYLKVKDSRVWVREDLCTKDLDLRDHKLELITWKNTLTMSGGNNCPWNNDYNQYKIVAPLRYFFTALLSLYKVRIPMLERKVYFLVSIESCTKCSKWLWEAIPPLCPYAH